MVVGRRSEKLMINKSDEGLGDVLLTMLHDKQSRQN